MREAWPGESHGWEERNLELWNKACETEGWGLRVVDRVNALWDGKSSLSWNAYPAIPKSSKLLPVASTSHTLLALTLLTLCSCLERPPP